MRERPGDRPRRREARRRHARKVEGALDSQISEALQGVGDQVRKALGLQAGRTPEQRAADALAAAAGLPEGALDVVGELYLATFRLVADVDEETARQLAERMRACGFDAEARPPAPPIAPDPARGAFVATAALVGLFSIALLPLLGPVALLLLALSIVGGTVAWAVPGEGRPAPPVAYADLAPHLRPGFEGLLGAATAEPAVLQGTLEALAALDRVLADHADALPAHVLADLGDDVRELRESAREIGERLGRVERELASTSDDAVRDAAKQLQARLVRLDQQGRGPEHAEVIALRRALKAHEEQLGAHDELEAARALAVAKLLEISAAATQARRELLREDAAAQAPRLGRELRSEARALAAAIQELRRRERA